MNIDIIDFYPGTKTQDKKYVGSLHIYFEDWDLDVRGIDVKKNGNKLFFNLPKRKVFDTESKKKVTFDVLSFTDPKKKEQLISFLQDNATNLVMQKLSALDFHKRDKYKS